MDFHKHLSAWALIAGVLSMAPAAAVEKQMEMAANAAANCQGALPNFEGSIRKRPLAVQNEGTTAAFVTCSFVSQYDTAVGAVQEVEQFSAWFVNKGSSEAVVTCTGIAGFETGADNVYISKTVTIAPDPTFQAQISFRADDNGGESFHPLVSLSCRIPPGVGINDTYVDYVFNDE